MTKNVVLVHGFWADSSSYSAIIPLLQKAGYQVTAPQMSLSSLEEDVLAVKRTLDRLDGDCLLVGHSYGGVVITHAGTHPKVKGLLYIAAFAPGPGEKMAGLLAKYPPTPMVRFFDVHEGFVWMKKEGVRTAFAQDLPAEQTDMLWAVQKAPKGAIFETLATAAAWKDKASWFIVATEDLAVPPELQRFEADRMNAETIEIAASHLPMLSKPAEVSGFIQEAAEQV